MNEPEAIALFYLIPIALWLALLGVLFRVWWSHKLEDSLAYLVFLRERKVLFLSLLGALTVLHVTVEVVNIANVLGWLGGPAVIGFGLVATLLGSLIVFLFAWFLLGAKPSNTKPMVFDGPEHLAYSLGIIDRAESGRTVPAPVAAPGEQARRSRPSTTSPHGVQGASPSGPGLPPQSRSL